MEKHPVNHPSWGGGDTFAVDEGGFQDVIVVDEGVEEDTTGIGSSFTAEDPYKSG